MKVYGNPEMYMQKGEYHPLVEYSRAKKRFKRAQYSPGEKFHKLAVKIENTLPRGLREKCASNLLTTTLLLEIENESKRKKNVG